MKTEQILLIIGGVLLVGFLARQQAREVLNSFGNVGSAIGDFLDPVNRRTLDELTSDIDCSHFNTTTERGRELRRRCLAGEL